MPLTQLRCVLIAAALAPLNAQAETTMKSATKIVIGFAAGSLDIVARVVAGRVRGLTQDRPLHRNMIDNY